MPRTPTLVRQMTMQLGPASKIRFNTRVMPWLAAGGALVVYLVTLNHWVSGGSLLQVAKASGWVWQTELYEPLFWVVNTVFHALPVSLVPLGLNLFAALCAFFTLAFLARSVALLPHDRTHEQRDKEMDDFGVLSIRSAWLPQVLAVTVCGLQMTFWENATAFSGEIFNLLIFAYVIRCLLEFRVTERESWLTRAAFAFGLGMTNNWAMIGFFPLFLMALIWTKGLTFFNLRFLGRMAAWGTGGLSFYLLLPLTQSFSDSTVPFWAVLKTNLGMQILALRTIYQNNRHMIALLSLTSLVPLFVISIRWASYFGDTSRLGVILTTIIFHLVHALFLGICIWVALDPPFSPRNVGLGLPFLTFYYLGAVVVGYCSGYFLLIFGGNPKRSSLLPDFVRLLNRVVTLIIWLVVLAAPVALVFRSLPQVKIANGGAIKQFADLATKSLPPDGCLVLSDDWHLLLLAQASLAVQGKHSEYMFVDVSAKGSLQYPRYHHYLKRTYPKRWPSEQLDDFHLIEPGYFLRLLNQLYRSNAVYYLHPSLGFYFETYYTEPHGLVQRIVSYPNRDPLPPPLTNELIKENEDFWASTDEQALRPLLNLITPPPSPKNPSILERFMKKAHAEHEINHDAIAAGLFYSRALNDWGVQMQRAGRLPEAASHFQRAVELYSGNVVAQRNLECNQNLQNGKSAAIELPKTIEDLFGAWRSWDQVTAADGPYDEPNVCFEQGRVFIRSRLYRQAALEFTRAFTLDPDNVSARVYMAQLEITGQKPDEALRLIEAAHQRMDSTGATNTEKGLLLFVELSAYLAKHDFAGAESALNATLQRYPQDPAPLGVATDVYMNYGLNYTATDTNLATQCFSNALAATERQLLLMPENTTNLINKGLALLRLGAFQQAIAPLTRALELQPENGFALLNRAIVYLQSGQLDLAQADYEALQKMYPKAFQVFFGLGDIAYKRHDTNEAIRNYSLYLTNSLPGTDEAKFVENRIKELKSGSP